MLNRVVYGFDSYLSAESAILIVVSFLINIHIVCIILVRVKCENVLYRNKEYS